MAVNDRCRLCRDNLRIQGVLSHCRKIFQKDTNAKSIEERLAELGLTLANVQERSFRICLKCIRFIARLEESLRTFREWQNAEKEPNHPTISSSTSSTTTASVADTTTTTTTASAIASKRDRAQTPSKQPPTPTAPPAPKLPRLATDNTPGRARQSVTEVVVYYPTRSKGERMVCPDDTAVIVEALARKNWNWAAKQITKHQELFGPLTEHIQNILEEECKKICSPFTHFMLANTSADNLKAFSFQKLQADFQRVSPFLYSMFLCVTKQSARTACVAASIALKGRDNHMSAFAYYVNSVLQCAGVKKAAFKRLGKLDITTSYTAALKKQKELAQTCGEDLKTLKVACEIFLREEVEKTSTACGGSVPKAERDEEATGCSTPSTGRQTDTHVPHVVY
ncbi:hypothetical protein D9C73_020947 [Collichthys lucidus]|uniref:ZAD domain-containing protein n=1 Tax=Collichthys lucidus TaxID=240159 RepID=A0A4U5VF45_COLLU|nr:hypothetical protein D9C73_020947 [Collichthys lucidus]